jgi:nickel superoxide dismutase
MKLSQLVLSTLAGEVLQASAHCDLPCGIYDPHQAIIGALTVVRMIDIIDELNGHEKLDPEHHQSLIRAIAIKESHAETCKREVRVIWGDYFKAEHKTKYPELDELVATIMQLGSKSKQTLSRDTAMELLQSINRFAEIFWETKGKETKKVKAPYKPEEEIVIPVL